MELYRGTVAHLVQNIDNFIDEVKPAIDRIVESSCLAFGNEPDFNFDEVLLWIIAEGLWELYGAHQLDHDRLKQPHRLIYDMLDNAMGGELLRYIRTNIKCLVLADEHREIDLYLWRSGLFTRYYGTVYNGEYTIKNGNSRNKR